MGTIYRIGDEFRRVFTTEDLLIIGLVAACVVLMPFFVVGLKKRSYVRVISLVVLAAYAAGELYFTLLDRHVIENSTNILTPLADIQAAFHVDLGIVGFFKELIQNGPDAALAAIHIDSVRKAREVLLNVLLYLPLGYLLPFCWKKLRKPSVITLIGFLCSLATETAQLHFKLGYFQVDDLICNTLGTLIGGLIGIALCALWRIE